METPISESLFPIKLQVVGLRYFHVNFWKFFRLIFFKEQLWPASEDGKEINC